MLCDIVQLAPQLRRNPLGRLRTHWLMIGVLTLSWIVGFAGPTPQATGPTGRWVDSVAGCYEVVRTPWQPALALGADSVFATLPSRLVIDTTPSGRRKQSWRTLRSNDARARQSPISSTKWRQIGPRRIEFIWAPAGLSGVHGRLDTTQNGFRGSIETFWDFKRPRQSADVVLTRRPCT